MNIIPKFTPPMGQTWCGNCQRPTFAEANGQCRECGFTTVTGPPVPDFQPMAITPPLVDGKDFHKVAVNREWKP